MIRGFEFDLDSSVKHFIEDFINRIINPIKGTITTKSFPSLHVWRVISFSIPKVICLVDDSRAALSWHMSIREQYYLLLAVSISVSWGNTNDSLKSQNLTERTLYTS